MPDANDSQSAASVNANQPAAPRVYRDLIIELRDLDSAADTFVVSVLPSSVGESVPAAVKLRLSTLQADLARLAKKTLKGARLIAFGERLGERLLPPGEVRDLYNTALSSAGRSDGLRLRLVIRDEELAQLPWEFAYIQKSGGEKNRSGFLALNPQISIVRHEVMPEVPWPLVAEKPAHLRMVIATAAITHSDTELLGEFDLAELDLELERDAIVNAVADLKVDGVTVDATRVLDEATIDDVKQALVAGADIFHFAGHGYYASISDEPEAAPESLGGFLFMHDEHGSVEGVPMSAEDLAMSLQRAGVRLAVLGACESARRDNMSPWTAVAPALVRRGLPAAVAMQYEVLDSEATAFSRMMYTNIAAGLSLDEAVSAGRQAMLGSADDSVEWGVPVLYMRSRSGVLFPEVVGRPAAVASQIRIVVQQVIDTVAEGGEAVGLRVRHMNDGSVEVTTTIGTLHGKAVAAEFGVIGNART